MTGFILCFFGFLIVLYAHVGLKKNGSDLYALFYGIGWGMILISFLLFLIS